MSLLLQILKQCFVGVTHLFLKCIPIIGIGIGIAKKKREREFNFYKDLLICSFTCSTNLLRVYQVPINANNTSSQQG